MTTIVSTGEGGDGGEDAAAAAAAAQAAAAAAQAAAATVPEHTHGPTEDDVSRAERLTLVEQQSAEHNESPHPTHDDVRSIARGVLYEEAAELQRMADEAAAAAVAEQAAADEAAAAAAAAETGEGGTIVTPDVTETPKESFFRRIL